MKIVIAGYGVEGRSNYVYFRQKFPEAELLIADEHAVADAPEGVATLSGKDVFARLQDAEMVVRTAGLPPRDIVTNGKIWSATNEFFAECPAPIIGVTGTKGKGTTCSFITEILRAAGKTVHLVGNIGQPALNILPDVRPDDVVVYELSSFQLWDLEKSPKIAVVLMIEPDHLDKHLDMDDYIAAKANIASKQTERDIIIYNQDNLYSSAIAKRSIAQKVPYIGSVSNEILKAVVIPGQHNRDNASAAVKAVHALMPQLDSEIVQRGLAGFTGLPHRLHYVGEWGGVRYYDDSIATTPGSAIAALRSFSEPKVLIIGGADKGADYDGVARELAAQTMRGVIVQGANSDKILSTFRAASVQCKVVSLGMVQMAEVVVAARQLAQPGDVVILSPAAASFDQYDNYAARGDAFIAALSAAARG